MFFKKTKLGPRKIPAWRFREMHPGEMNVDPIEGEFFNTEAIASLSNALVREAIQNSLDASVGKGPVTVRFNFINGPETVSKEKLEKAGRALAMGLMTLGREIEY